MTKRGYIVGFAIVALLAVGMFRAKEGARKSAGEIEQLEAEIKSLESEIELLKKDFKRARSHDVIARYAREELGMGPVRADQLLDADDVERRIGPATAPETIREGDE